MTETRLKQKLENNLKTISDTLKGYDGMIKSWPIALLMIGVLGHIGFFTYTQRYDIPFEVPDMNLIAGLGIFNILILIAIYFTSPLAKWSILVQMYYVGFIIEILTDSPIMLLKNILIIIGLPVVIIFYLKTKDLEDTMSHFLDKYGDKIVFICLKIAKYLVAFLLVIGSVYNAIFYFTIFVLIELINFVKKKNITARLYTYGLILLVLPFLSSNIDFAGRDKTVFGLSNLEVSLTTLDGQNYTGKMVYKNDAFTYIRMVNDSSFYTLTIPDSRIEIIEGSAVEQGGIVDESVIILILEKLFGSMLWVRQATEPIRRWVFGLFRSNNGDPAMTPLAPSDTSVNIQ